MKHPIDKYNQQQAKLLEQLPAEERPWHEGMFRIGNTAYCYHRQVTNPTEVDFKDWLEGLPANFRENMEAQGFEACKTMLPFTRHVQERRDNGLEEWMQQHLSEDYQWWQSGQGSGQNINQPSDEI